MEAANAGLSRGQRRIVLRVGINLGDVIVEGSDLYGDGVNIAARLEAAGRTRRHLSSRRPSSAICRSKVELHFDDLGEQSLKNMAEPVQVLPGFWPMRRASQ